MREPIAIPCKSAKLLHSQCPGGTAVIPNMLLFFLSQVNFFDFDQLYSGADFVPAINGFFFALNVISQLVCANEVNFEVDTLSSVSISKAFTCLIYGPSSLVKLNPAVKG